MGGRGKNQKKIHARVNAKKKNSCKEEDKEKKFMQKESPIVTFIYIFKKKMASVYKSSSHSENSWSLTSLPLLLISKDI